MKPTFNNKANRAHTVGEKTIWESRSPAVVAIILGKYNNNLYVITEKRSSIMLEPNKWAVVSGFLDWDENGYDGIVRETYEETGFYIPDFKDRLLFDNNKQPFYVHTDPLTDAQQNISLTYVFIYDFDKGLPMEIESYQDKEIDQVKWMEMQELFNNDLDWAFYHDKRIMMALEKFQRYL